MRSSGGAWFDVGSDGSVVGPLVPLDPRRFICDAFGVTPAEVDALDRALLGPETRAAEQRFREELPAWIGRVIGEANGLLPCGLTFRYPGVV